MNFFPSSLRFYSLLFLLVLLTGCSLALPRHSCLCYAYFGELLGEEMGAVERQFDGVSPYFVPGKAGVKAFTELQQQGVQVRMLTNSLEATNKVKYRNGFIN